MEGVPREDLAFFHHRHPHNQHKNPKFKIPRKRASKLFAEINADAVKKSTEGNPDVLKVPFDVGDAIEITMVSSGGVDSNDLEKIRGVVLGVHKRGLGTGVYIRDMLFGQPVERKVPLHSPLLKSLKVLKKNFIGKKNGIKRAKLYYLRDLNPTICRVTKGK
eukprot:CAMPEP_0195528910 /NCGR_PEP_ID=MMETSP0794_2-20130614/31265_1 /TAXON_ID=515487 /ORGANISM="Stephanopyxis turris, Strain CCMP 815" /LENGTH=161 /DNA_ID=CAMNT_0040660121 /DNA_START=194 /DNA_END=679 /DNA_ORIENTATION=+